MTNTNTAPQSFTLNAPFRGETLTFRPTEDGRHVYVDHRFPQGMPGYCYRPGVGLMNKRYTVKAARERYRSALKAGWVRA